MIFIRNITQLRKCRNSHLSLTQIWGPALIFPDLFLISDIRRVRICRRLSESHAVPHRPQVRQPSGGHQILRPGHVSQTRVLKHRRGRRSDSPPPSSLLLPLGFSRFLLLLWHVVNVSTWDITVSKHKIILPDNAKSSCRSYALYEEKKKFRFPSWAQTFICVTVIYLFIYFYEILFDSPRACFLKHTITVLLP